MILSASDVESLFDDVSNAIYLTSGGQKAVYTISHSQFGDVILKLFESGSDIQRIEREIKAMTLMAIKNTPKIFESGEITTTVGTVFYVIEQKISGTTLSEKIKIEGSLKFDEVIPYAHALLDILAEAESKNIVHRDIKPSNIMIDDAGALWLFDYGIARHLEMDSLTNTSDVMGASTPGYAPVEQFRNRKGEIDSRSDLFSVGVTLYECLTGGNPYYHNAKGPLDVLDKVENERLPKLSGFTSDGEFEDLIYELTQPTQEHRPISAADAAEWINQIMEKL
ncbi:serine/threonine-protein kinase [Deinococcus metalli]|uniref:Serine/threonine-protein kinase n=1 Tax=Deinococcus metalli TaxID=1141878 RepID=A0A7W8NSB7_9DEIO|nr:serine/threonine-protein kinase [Deinococcus metalli]MBB5378785.1 serine/threonine-protein kinase [Deinococcus metalli]GHF60749.1 hypothetical protein GCM10017781_41250 [Deinococcus metalli]